MKKAIAAITLAIVLTQSTAMAMSARSTFDYSNYPHWVKSECRELCRVNGHVDFNKALRCAENTMEDIRDEEYRRSTVRSMDANTELSKELTRRMKRNR